MGCPRLKINELQSVSKIVFVVTAITKANFLGFWIRAMSHCVLLPCHMLQLYLQHGSRYFDRLFLKVTPIKK